MSLPNGEYPIDVSQLIDTISPVNDHHNVALRYGFIPDSMDQQKPLTLYQNGQECILKAGSIDGKPILFEGIPQRYREGQPNDAYYLAFENNKVALKRLNSTIRFNKSRNVAQLQQKMDRWEKDKKDEDRRVEKERKEREKWEKERPERERKERERKEREDRERRERLRQRELEKARKTRPAKRPGKTVAKRTPAIHEESIISESDFDDIPDDISKAPSADYVRAPTQKPIVENIDGDMDDDFKDLEDQLQEVLGEDDDKPASKSSASKSTSSLGNSFGAKSYNYDDSDSDADDYAYNGLGINIRVEEGDQPKVYRNSFAGNSSQKPTSLRDYVQDESSEEE